MSFSPSFVLENSPPGGYDWGWLRASAVVSDDRGGDRGCEADSGPKDTGRMKFDGPEPGLEGPSSLLLLWLLLLIAINDVFDSEPTLGNESGNVLLKLMVVRAGESTIAEEEATALDFSHGSRPFRV